MKARSIKMKASLEFYYPQKMRDLSRIESHIRLHSSLWYACFYLRYISIIGVIFGVLSNWIMWHRFGSFELKILFLPIIVYIGSFMCQSLIEKAFHYQRTREVFYVLKFAQLAQELAQAEVGHPDARLASATAQSEPSNETASDLPISAHGKERRRGRRLAARHPAEAGSSPGDPDGVRHP
jgi:hypothetical protein